MYNQLVQMPGDRLTSKIFHYDKQFADKNGSWSSNVSNILLSLDAIDLWNSETPVNMEYAKRRLCEMYESTWLREIQRKSKLRLFQTFKTSFSCGEHLHVNLKKNERSLLSRLRCGILSLAIETDRYSGTPCVNRICRLCKIEPETETHFLFRCIANTNTRNKHYHGFPEILNFSKDEDKIKLLNTKPFKFGKFIDELWQNRANILNKECIITRIGWMQ